MEKLKQLKILFEDKHEISKEIINSKNPMIILGESFFKLKSAIIYLI